MQQMAADQNLSGLVAFDCTSILRNIMIFILAFAHTRMHIYRSEIEDSIALLRSMEQIGFCKMVTVETPMRLAEMGITEEAKVSNTGVLLDDDLIAQLWGNLDT